MTKLATSTFTASQDKPKEVSSF